MRYDGGMKKFFAMLLALLMLGLVQPGAANERTDALLDGLMDIGGRALQAQAERRQAKRAEEQGADAGKEPDAGLPAAPAAGDASPLQQALTGSFRQSLDGIVGEYKEKYKEEGRAYARELGDIIVERVNTDSKIGELLARTRETLDTVEALCWSVIAYLTLVTLTIVVSLLYIKRSNAHILAEMRGLRADWEKRGQA